MKTRSNILHRITRVADKMHLLIKEVLGLFQDKPQRSDKGTAGYAKPAGGYCKRIDGCLQN